MDDAERRRIRDALDEIREALDNLPPEPHDANETVGGYFYNQWSPAYGRWIRMRGALARAERELKELLGETGSRARRA